MVDSRDRYFLRTFEHFLLSTTIADVRQRLDNAHQQRGNTRYGLILDDSGQLLALISTTAMKRWPDDKTLADIRLQWPTLYTLPEVEATNIVDVARFFEEELTEQPHLPGIVLIDTQGQPTAILRRRALMQALAGEDELLSRGIEVSPDDKNARRELQVKRYGRIQFSAQVSLHNPCQLVITMNRQLLAGGANQVELGLTRHQWPLKVLATLVSVQPEDFLIRGTKSRVIEVPRMADSTPLVFTLIPQSVGEKNIYIRFEQVIDKRADYIATTCIQTEVIISSAEHSGDAEICNAPRLSSISDAPDVTIYIKQISGLHYSVCVRTPEDDPLSEARQIDKIEFPQAPDMYLRRIFAMLDERISNRLSPSEYDKEVKKIGNNLYDNLFHEQGFKKFYWEYMDQLTQDATVQIISDEPYIPWEILRPFRQKTDGRWVSDSHYFCERFSLSRWLSGPQRGSYLPLHTVILVAPLSDLSWVDEEVDTIREIPGINVNVIQEKQQLEVFFQSGEADVIHFACHGSFQATDPANSWLLLRDAKLYPGDITAENRNFACTQPLVFLNACDSGRQGIGLTSLDGWAKKFLDAGVGFFIGSMWKTTDQLAYEFARAFYQHLQAGDCIAEAVRQARQTVAHQGDATHLSYTLYAHPRVRAHSV